MVSNLPFPSKILEGAVDAQLHQHKSNHELYEPLQSGFRPHHAVVTTLSAGFHTVCHTILLNRLSKHLSLGTDLSSGSNPTCPTGNSYSPSEVPGLPQPQSTKAAHKAQCWAPFFSPSTCSRFEVSSFNMAADDTQLYLSTHPSTPLPPPPVTSQLPAWHTHLDVFKSSQSLQLQDWA